MVTGRSPRRHSKLCTGAIITGQLRPGTRLPIEELAEVLEMSPMPVREAVRRLDAAGLVENSTRTAGPASPSCRSGISPRSMKRAWRSSYWRFVAQRCASASATNPPPAGAGGPAAASRRQLAATSVAHAEFHFALYEAADSAWLLAIDPSPRRPPERYCLAVPECRQLAGRRREHEEILDACVAHDPDRAGLALRDHLARTADNIAVAMGSEPLPALATAAPSAAQVSPLQVLALEEL